MSNHSNNIERTLAFLVVLGLAIAGAAAWWMASPDGAPPPTRSAAKPAPAQLVADPRCPPEMAYIDARTLRLGQPQPERRGWPPATVDPLPAVSVPAFCLDITPVSREAFAQWSGSEALRGAACDWEAPAPDGADGVVCIDRDSAAAFCAARDDGARLPSIHEWESQARTPEHALYKGPLREWASDPAPPAAFARHPEPCADAPCGWGMFRQRPSGARPASPDGRALWDWYTQEPANRWGNLGFRCAADPSAS